MQANQFISLFLSSFSLVLLDLLRFVLLIFYLSILFYCLSSSSSELIFSASLFISLPYSFPFCLLFSFIPSLLLPPIHFCSSYSFLSFQYLPFPSPLCYLLTYRFLSFYLFFSLCFPSSPHCSFFRSLSHVFVNIKLFFLPFVVQIIHYFSFNIFVCVFL